MSESQEESTTSTEENENTDRNKYTFSRVINSYIQHMESLREIFPLIVELLISNVEKESKQVNTFLEENNIEESEKEDGITAIRIPSTEIREFLALNSQVEGSMLALDFIPINFVVSFVSQYDAFLGNIIRAIFNVRPEILNASEKNITFSELMAFKDIDEAREYIIEKEVETVLRESHIDQFKWLEKKLGMELRKDLPSFKEFVEITERRNLFVHTNGVVSRQYLQICKENKVDDIEKVKLGSKLKAGPSYVSRCFSVMFEIGVKLGQVLWRKLQPLDLENADGELNEICYNLMVKKRLKLSINLLTFASETLKKHHDQVIVYMFIINKALAYYLSGDKKKTKEILDKTDWSATADMFKLARHVLLEEYEAASSLMLSIGFTNEIVNQNSYREWPLFSEFRQTDLFKATYKKIFDEEFTYIEKKPKRLSDIVSILKDKKLDKASADLDKPVDSLKGNEETEKSYEGQKNENALVKSETTS